MTNTLSIILAIALVAGIAYDVLIHGGANLVFLGKKLAELIEWLAFWR